MIEIYLNPDNDTMGGEVFENLDGDTGWVAGAHSVVNLYFENAVNVFHNPRPHLPGHF